jgi:choline-glycine betaine transporter
MSLNSEQITALAQGEADAAVAQPTQSQRPGGDSARRNVALVLFAVCWTLTGLMYWSGRWQALQSVAAFIAAPALVLMVASVLRALRAAREALEAVDAHD